MSDNTYNEAQLLKRVDQEVYCRINLIGEHLMRDDLPWVHIHYPLLEDDEGFEPMQYFLISSYLAEKMLAQPLTRDAIIEIDDGTWIWVRCGCGYALSEDLKEYLV